MWDNPTLYLVLGIGLIAAVLTHGYWGNWVYAAGQSWKLLTFVAVLGILGIMAVMMQQNLKYELTSSYWFDSAPQDNKELAYRIRQCKEFVHAKANGERTAEYREISAGPVNISKVSYYDYCARTFGMNFWRYDLSIDGQDGGRLLCDTYARDTYRSSKVQSWCDTVFAPQSDRSPATDKDEPPKDRET